MNSYDSTELQRFADILSVSCETLLERGCRWMIKALVRKRTLLTIGAIRECTGASLMDLKHLAVSNDQLLSPAMDQVWADVERGDTSSLSSALSGRMIGISVSAAEVIAAMVGRIFAIRIQRVQLLGKMKQVCQQKLLHTLLVRQGTIKERLCQHQQELELVLFD